MPKLQVTTKSSQQGWQSPDGKITAYDLILETGDGKQFKTQTYSKAIAEEGWSGEVETYEKNGRTYVKQPQREGGSWGGGGGGYKGGGKSQPDNPHTMYLSYAKDIAVAMIAAGTFKEADYQKVIDALASAGDVLYSSRPGAEVKNDKPADDWTNTPVSEGSPFDGVDTL